MNMCCVYHNSYLLPTASLLGDVPKCVHVCMWCVVQALHMNACQSCVVPSLAVVGSVIGGVIGGIIVLLLILIVIISVFIVLWNRGKEILELIKIQ